MSASDSETIEDPLRRGFEEKRRKLLEKHPIRGRIMENVKVEPLKRENLVIQNEDHLEEYDSEDEICVIVQPYSEMPKDLTDAYKFGKRDFMGYYRVTLPKSVILSLKSRREIRRVLV